MNIPVQKRFYPLWWLLLSISSLPLPVLYRLADILYGILYYVIRYRKKVVYENLQNAFPEKSEIEREAVAKQFYRHLTDIIVETLKLATLPAAELKSRVRILNPEVITAETERGHLVLALGGHQCNWEWAPTGGIPYFPFPVEVVYKPLNNVFFEAFIRRLRTRLGPNMVRMKDTLRHLLQHKKEPRLFCMLSDQTPPKSEIQYWTTFMNQPAGFFVGGEKLAALFKMPVYFIQARRVERGRYDFMFIPIQPSVQAQQTAFPVTEEFARMLEAWIHENPADYLWSHRRWKHTRPQSMVASPQL